MCKGMTGRKGTMDELRKEDIYIKKRPTTITVLYYYTCTI
jgi:hypothetical protein